MATAAVSLYTAESCDVSREPACRQETEHSVDREFIALYNTTYTPMRTLVPPMR